jgi:hypothetical protein
VIAIELLKQASNPTKNVKLIPTGTIRLRFSLSAEINPIMSYPLNAKKQTEAPENI